MRLVTRMNPYLYLVNAPSWLAGKEKDKQALIELTGEFRETIAQLKAERTKLLSAQQKTKSMFRMFLLEERISQISSEIKTLSHRLVTIKKFLEEIKKPSPAKKFERDLDKKRSKDYSVKVTSKDRLLKLERQGYPRKRVKEKTRIIKFHVPQDYTKQTIRNINLFAVRNWNDPRLLSSKDAGEHQGRLIIGMKVIDEDVKESVNRKEKLSQLKDSFYRRERERLKKIKRMKKSPKKEQRIMAFQRDLKKYVESNYQKVKRSEQGITYISTHRRDYLKSMIDEANEAIDIFRKKYIFASADIKIVEIYFSKTISTFEET